MHSAIICRRNIFNRNLQLYTFGHSFSYLFEIPSPLHIPGSLSEYESSDTEFAEGEGRRGKEGGKEMERRGWEGGKKIGGGRREGRESLSLLRKGRRERARTEQMGEMEDEGGEGRRERR